MIELPVKTHTKTEIVDITKEVQEIVDKSKIKNGLCCLYIPHTTAGIIINENADPTVKEDIINMLNKLVPFTANYQHTEGNAFAHIKSSIVGNSKIIFIENGEIKLGTWQGIFFCEFDGPRSRYVWIKIIPA